MTLHQWVSAMVTGSYRDFFVVIATSAVTLIVLLFLATSVSTGRAQDHQGIRSSGRQPR